MKRVSGLLSLERSAHGLATVACAPCDGRQTPAREPFEHEDVWVLRTHLGQQPNAVTEVRSYEELHKTVKLELNASP